MTEPADIEIRYDPETQRYYAGGSEMGYATPSAARHAAEQEAAATAEQEAEQEAELEPEVAVQQMPPPVGTDTE